MTHIHQHTRSQTHTHTRARPPLTAAIMFRAHAVSACAVRGHHRAAVRNSSLNSCHLSPTTPHPDSLLRHDQAFTQSSQHCNQTSFLGLLPAGYTSFLLLHCFLSDRLTSWHPNMPTTRSSRRPWWWWWWCLRSSRVCLRTRWMSTCTQCTARRSWRQSDCWWCCR